MKKIVITLILFLILITVITAYFFLFIPRKGGLISPLSKITEKPLEKYTFEALRNKKPEASNIQIGKILNEGNGFKSYMFYFYTQGKKASGLINLPDTGGTYPIIVMFRGFVDREKYTTGEGTRHSGEVFAQNGFISLAPDFLGYGESASPSASSIEERFQTYTTALTLLASVKNLNSSLKKVNGNNIQADETKIGIWGHSNGGHIALSVLSITGKSYPAVLWAPVSKPFPYSILYFTDEFDDNGKALRKVVADFEEDYDIEKYSPSNFYKWINAPIQVHQGNEDEAVPQRWSDTLYKNLKDLDKDIDYYTYSGENHNFNNGNWPIAVQRSIQFYKERFNN